MIESPSCFEFYIDVDGSFRRYFVGPVYASNGDLRQVSIRYDSDATNGQKIGIDIDRDIFKQFAMPNPETLSRIAIAQAGQDCLFGEISYHAGQILDFAIEPWEGDLTPVDPSFRDEMFVDLDVE